MPQSDGTLANMRPKVVSNHPSGSSALFIGTIQDYSTTPQVSLPISQPQSTSTKAKVLVPPAECSTTLLAKTETAISKRHESPERDVCQKSLRGACRNRSCPRRHVQPEGPDNNASAPLQESKDLNITRSSGPSEKEQGKQEVYYESAPVFQVCYIASFGTLV